jgi:cysteine-rich repeat protein
MSMHRAGLLSVLFLLAFVVGAIACSSRNASAPPGGTANRDGGVSGTDGSDGSGGGGIVVVDGGLVGEDASDPRYEQVDAGPQCGDLLVNQPGEECDDGNKLAADGCSPACKVEPYYTCPPEGGACVPTMVCGDLQITGIEQCDDGNTTPGDGCSARCLIEASYYDCPNNGGVGGPCVSTAACGNGSIEPGESCDDAAPADGDGCSSACQVESGWICPMPGSPCVPNCGDGAIVAGAEECDDGNSVTGDGCSVSCMIEPGWSCSGTPSVCTASDCGNGVVEAGEQCDLGADNGLFYGDGTGCSKTCTSEPLCRDAGGGPTRACDSVCGDGMVVGAEQCDDGNLVDNDGCSSGCAVEGGFTCNPVTQSDAEPCSTGGGNCLILPIILRDFPGAQEANGHPDFFYMGANGVICVPDASGAAEGDATARCPGLVADTLNNQGKPSYSGSSSCPCQFTDWDATGILNGVSGTTQYTEGDTTATRINTTVHPGKTAGRISTIVRH